jgi:phage shock protein E
MLPRCARLFALLLPLALAATAWAGEVYWIDVRTAEEYSAGHVDGAINIPYEEIGARISAVTENRDAEIYLYCRSGRRSGIALQTLQQAGFSRAVNAGGLKEAMQTHARLEHCRDGDRADC